MGMFQVTKNLSGSQVDYEFKLKSISGKQSFKEKKTKLNFNVSLAQLQPKLVFLFGTSGRRSGGGLATTLVATKNVFIGTSGRHCSWLPLGGRLATTLVATISVIIFHFPFHSILRRDIFS